MPKINLKNTRLNSYITQTIYHLLKQLSSKLIEFYHNSSKITDVISQRLFTFTLQSTTFRCNKFESEIKS